MSHDADIALVRKTFEALGFLTQQVAFEQVVAEGEFRDILISDWAESSVGLVLRHMPDLFVLHTTAEPDKAALFVSVLAANEELQSEAQQVYDEFYPREVAVVRLLHGSRCTRITSRWSGEDPGCERPLARFVADASIPSPSSGILEGLRGQGVEIT